MPEGTAPAMTVLRKTLGALVVNAAITLALSYFVRAVMITPHVAVWDYVVLIAASLTHFIYLRGENIEDRPRCLQSSA